MSTRRKIFYGFTVAVILLFVFLPATSWLIHLQLLPIYPGGKTGMNYFSIINRDSGKAYAVLSQAAQKNPSEFASQFALAVQPGDSAEVIRRLEELQKQFPNEPTVPAAILRFMCSEQIHIDREDTNLLSASPKEPTPGKKKTPPTAKDLARFDALAAKWEERQPNNAYFSMMRAVGFFAGHKDTEAIAAWKRAAEKPEWNDYATYEMAARARLLEQVNGGKEPGFLLRSASWSAILFPHYVAMRRAAQIATVKAVESELSGNTGEGFIIRRATRQLGEKIAVQGQTTISNLVGGAIAAISQPRPGGMPAMKGPGADADAQSKKAFTKKTRAAYISYLQRIGHPEEAVAFQTAMEKSEQIKALSKAGMAQSYFGFDTKAFRLVFCWLADCLLIIGVLLSVAFSVIFGIVFRFSPRLQKGEPLQNSARWGAALAILPLIGFLLAGWIASKLDESLINIPLWIWIGACLLGLLVPPFLLRLTARQVGHGLLIFLASLFGVGVLIGAMALGVSLFYGAFTTLNDLGLTVTGIDEPSRSYWTTNFPVIVGTTLMLLPIVLLGLFALCSRILRIPVASGVTRGMRAMGIPLACLLVFGYIACFFATLHYENAAIAETKRVQEIGELQTYAEITGKPMPTMQ